MQDSPSVLRERPRCSRYPRAAPAFPVVHRENEMQGKAIARLAGGTSASCAGTTAIGAAAPHRRYAAPLSPLPSACRRGRFLSVGSPRRGGLRRPRLSIKALNILGWILYDSASEFGDESNVFQSIRGTSGSGLIHSYDDTGCLDYDVELYGDLDGHLDLSILRHYVQSRPERCG